MSAYRVSESPRRGKWQDRRESNPQPPVLETGALPIELLSYTSAAASNQTYFVSRCGTCFRQNRQYLLISMRSVVFFLFFVVL